MKTSWAKILLIMSLLCWQIIFASNSAVLIMYHRVGDSRYPTTNVTQAQFNQEMAYLAEQHYQVWPMSKIVNYLQTGKPLPEKVVGISFDDAYESAYQNAWPVLKKYHFPFTLFVATAPIDQHSPEMMTWSEIKTLADNGVEIGNHSVNHPHLAAASAETIKAELTQAQQRIQQAVGVTATLFAYPFGEFSQRFVQLVKQTGFTVGFTQISGAVNAQSDFYLLPRFPINEHYADFARFKGLLNMQPLIISDLQPADTRVQQNPPEIQFKVATPNLKLTQLKCYMADGDPVSIDMQQAPLIKLQLQQKLTLGRNRINCTTQDNAGQWHWLGLLFIR